MRTRLYICTNKEANIFTIKKNKTMSTIFKILDLIEAPTFHENQNLIKSLIKAEFKTKAKFFDAIAEYETANAENMNLSKKYQTAFLQYIQKEPKYKSAIQKHLTKSEPENIVRYIRVLHNRSGLNSVNHFLRKLQKTGFDVQKQKNCFGFNGAGKFHFMEEETAPNIVRFSTAATSVRFYKNGHRFEFNNSNAIQITINKI